MDSLLWQLLGGGALIYEKLPSSNAPLRMQISATYFDAPTCRVGSNHSGSDIRQMV